jgi:hypothetical protein
MFSVNVQNPAPGAIVLASSPLTVGGVATAKGFPEPSVIDRVTVEVDGGPLVTATIKQLPPHHGSPAAWTYHAQTTAPAMPGSHRIRVKAFDDTGTVPPATATVYFVVGLPLTATVTFRTASDQAKGPFTFAVVIGTSFSTDRRVVEIVSFPVLATPDVTVTLVGGGTGDFNPISGEMHLPVSLLFHPSSSLASDSTLNLTLTTGAQRSPHHTFNDQGKPMQTDGSIVLVGDGVFDGGFPLGGNDASLVLAGKFSPHP